MNVLLIGANGGIGKAFLEILINDQSVTNITATSRHAIDHKHEKLQTVFLDFKDEVSIQNACEAASSYAPLDFVIVATGLLHDGPLIQPEKAMRDLSRDKFDAQFFVNCIGPALVAKYAIAKMNKNNQSIFVAFSARVGSISDNALGGWYAYRAAKAALNMTLKNLAIETNRSNKNAIIVGLHPGTVDTKLSKPFQTNVQAGKLFSPDYAAQKLWAVLNGLKPNDNGQIFDYKGDKVEP